MSSELKSCPFCGHKKPVRKRLCRGGVLLVRCYTRECPLSHVAVRADDWNRRAPSPAVKALVEALKEVYVDGYAVDLKRFDEALAAVEREIQQ